MEMYFYRGEELFPELLSIKVCMFKEKIKATSAHLLITIFLSIILICAINHFWFPYGTINFLKGINLFLLVLACDIVLGPLLSFVAYDSKKSRRELILDYTLIVAIQVAAMIYGLYSISQNRLQFLVFTVDRYEIVSAGELSSNDLLKLENKNWDAGGLLSSHVFGVIAPTPTDENYIDAVINGLNGRDIQFSTESYVPLESISSDVKKKIRPIDDFPSDLKNQIIKFIPNSVSGDDVGWLPLSHERNFWTMLVNKNTGKPIKAVPFDPYKWTK